MAILDVLTLLSGSYANGAITGQTATGTDTSVVSTNSYDTTGGSAAGQIVDLGKGEPLDVQIDVLTAASGGTSVEFQFISADNAALTTNVTVIGSSGAIPVANLTAGKRVKIDVPSVDPRTLRRYVGVRYVFVGAVAAGAYSAAMTKAGDLPQPSWTSGFSVS